MEPVTKQHPFPMTCAEFFAGIGLMRMGLEAQGWTTLFANDIDVQKYKMYSTQFPDADTHFHLGDIHHLPASDVPTVSLATASFPCTDLSLAGSRSGLSGKQSSAFWGFMSILQDMGNRRPPLVLLENVTGFLTSEGGKDFREALLALNSLGYSVDALVLDASYFVPQSRQRLFVIGVRNDKQPSNLSAGLSFYGSTLRPKALADFIFLHPEIGWNVRSLPDPLRASCSLSCIVEDLPLASPEWWSAERASYLLEQMSPRHRLIADQMISAPECSYGTVFRRIRNEKSMAELRTDGIAGCLRTPKGGSGRQILFKAGFGQYQVRLLTPRECARLMGADDYQIDVPLNQALFGFGDAVCVPVVEWITRNYLNPTLEELAEVYHLPVITGKHLSEEMLVNA